MNKIIIPTGYMGSGSSAITDLLSEYKENYCPLDNFEFVFLHCPNGVLDFVDKLIYNNNALKSSKDIDIFYNEMQKLYNKKHWWVGNYQNVIGPRFMQITNNYINSLIDCEYEGYWYVHEELNFKMYIKLIFRKPIKMLFKNLKFKPVINSDGNMKISFKSEKEIYEETKKYIKEIVNCIKKEDRNTILDQLILPFNAYRSDKLFDEEDRIIIVERDPRDVFILNKYIWRAKHFDVPIPIDAKQFSIYYKKMRESEIISNNKNVLRIHFEDLVYQYDKSKKQIEKFINLNSNNQYKKKRFFNPDDSIKNTQVFRRDEYKEEISIIEKELKDYLYDFPYELNNSVDNSIETYEIDRGDIND